MSRTLSRCVPLFAFVLAGCGGGNEVRVTVPFNRTFKLHQPVRVVQVPANCLTDQHALVTFLSGGEATTNETATCLMIYLEATPGVLFKTPILVKIDDDQVQKLKAGAKLVLIDDSGKQHPTGYTIE